ncbi:hypothetical protein FHU33_4090 [Blastococcus colisei]|uniref:Uncharacterized protein n=1 Tax=Blastococcus colisei TaxID=1564162 RepID=A0A543P056_9ACTN|nr:hypothetical protein [Blastococcus colisei]TQN37438.1 hypothetical protein FHU33_4090 [Blastococcus colisei]
MNEARDLTHGDPKSQLVTDEAGQQAALGKLDESSDAIMILHS